MARKIVSIKAELNVLRGLCSKDKKISGTLLSLIDEDYFYHSTSKTVYKYIKSCIEKTGEAPSYEVLIEDPEFPSDAKEYIEQSVPNAVTSIEDANKAVTTLNKFRQTRGLANLAKEIALNLEGEKLNLDKLLDSVATEVATIRSTKANKDSFLHFGKGNNSRDFIHDLLFADHTDALIPTGYNVFDSVSGGLPRQGLVTIGANSGMGKSLLAGDLAIKMATQGYKVVMVPLEMSKAEMASRIMANVSDTDLSKIIQGKMTDEEKQSVYNKYERWARKCARLGGRLTIFKPEGDLDIGEIFASVATYNPDVCIVDYISLLKGLDGDDQWLRLGAIARQAKTNAETEHRVNILLCQVNDDGKIRYARSISEHCIAGDSLLDTDKGFIPISSLYPEAIVASTKPLTGIKVKSDGGYHNITAVHYNGIRNVYKVTLVNGMSITCTSSHKFRALDNQNGQVKWKELRHVNVGDYLAIDNPPAIFRFVQVKSIEPMGEKPVYDITVDPTHSYVANGFVVHNSNVSWIWTGNQETKESGIIKVEQPKSRNALAFPFLLNFDYAKMKVKDVPQDMLDAEEISVPKKKTKPEKNLASDI